MTRRSITAEQLGRLARMQRELSRRVRKGALPVERILTAVEDLIEGRCAPTGNRTMLVHWLFLDPQAQIRKVRRWNKEYGWGFGRSDFERAAAAVPEWPDAALTALVLVPYLGNAPETFKGLWGVATLQHPNYRLFDRVDGDHVHEYHATGHPRARSLRWEIIDLANDGPMRKAGNAARRGEAHAGILAAAALHPEWVRAMDGRVVPYVTLRGYDVTVVHGPGYPQSRSCIPILSYCPKRRMIMLSLVEQGNFDAEGYHDYGIAEPRLLSVTPVAAR